MPAQGKIVWSKPERFSVWSGALTTAGDVVFYGTLEGYLKAVSTKDGKELWKFKTPSGIIGNVFTYEYDGKQYVGVVLGHRRLGRHRHGGGPDRKRPKASARSAATRISPSTRRSAARCSCSRCRTRRARATVRVSALNR